MSATMSKRVGIAVVTLVCACSATSAQAGAAPPGAGAGKAPSHGQSSAAGQRLATSCRQRTVRRGARPHRGHGTCAPQTRPAGKGVAGHPPAGGERQARGKVHEPIAEPHGTGSGAPSSGPEGAEAAEAAAEARQEAAEAAEELSP